MFMGEFRHNLDAKARVIMPSKFRELLGAKFIITKGFDKNLSIYSLNDWLALKEKLEKIPITSYDARNIRRMIVGGAFELEADKQGRVLIPANLREYAEIEKEITIVGNLDYIELWSTKKWLEISNIDVDLAASNLFKAGINL